MATKHIINDENHVVDESVNSIITIPTLCHIEGIGHIDSDIKYGINKIYVQTKTLEVDSTVDKTAEFTNGLKILLPNHPGGTGLSVFTELTVISSSWDGTYTQVIVTEDCQDVYDNSDWIVYINNGNSPYGFASHTEGQNCIASGAYAHAEGENCIAKGSNSHAEGKSCVANTWSHAEGYMTIANSQADHAEGDNTLANGGFSHAEGSNTIASAMVSHAEGWGSKAYITGMHAKQSSANDKGQYGNITVWCETSNNTKTKFQAYNTQWIPLQNNTIYAFKVLGLGTDDSGNSATYTITGVAKNIADTVTVSNVVVTELSDDFTITGMSAEADNTWKGLVITATGKLATVIKWEAFVEWVEITFAV
jgi:hypothetical protein